MDRALFPSEIPRDTLPDFHANMAMASPAPLPPELLERRAAARGDQEAANRVYMVGEGLVSP